jgi:NTP pyrophosphatase (non-canonical NTP hydrolase)
MIHDGSSLKEFQELNNKIYLVVNDRNYSNAEILSILHRHITQVLKAVRKEKYDNVEYYLCMSFSWAFALLNRFHIDLDKEMWKRFPGYCPYCSTAPCSCKERAEDRQETAGKSEGQKPESMMEWQEMFARIYPNLVINSAMHLAEEAGEVDEAIRNYSATHNKEWFIKIMEELVDVVTNIFGVANCLKINLAAELVNHFDRGCTKCHQIPCECGFVTVDKPIHLSRRKVR